MIFEQKTFTFVDGVQPLNKLETTTIDGKRYYITPTGAKYPSVTTVLGHFSKSKLKKWRDRVGADEAQKISNQAATRGTRFHTLMEQYISNDASLQEKVKDMVPTIKANFLSVLPTLNRIDNIRYVESPLYSHKLKVAGRTDVIGNFDGILSIIDFKTSTKPKKESWITNYFEQGTCYALMHNELIGIRIDQIVIIIAVDDQPMPQIFIKSKKDYIDGLMTKIWHYHKEHKHVS